jgi:trehalose utilization protein
MGLVVLHSGHWSKIFRSLMGTSCNLRWRSIGEREFGWTVNAAHPITMGVPPVFAIEAGVSSPIMGRSDDACAQIDLMVRPDR